MSIDFFERFLLIFSSLFVIVEPFGVIPTFLSLTKKLEAERTKKVVLKATLFGAVVLVFFSLFGNYVFQLLQINLSAFKAAGGILLFLTALDMLRARNEDRNCSPSEKASGQEGHDISFVPLGMPLLTGPGAITSVMVFSKDHSENHAYHFLIILLAIASVFTISYFVLKYSAKVKLIMGESGMTVVQRLMGLLLAAISLQFIIEGSLKLIKMGLS